MDNITKDIPGIAVFDDILFTVVNAEDHLKIYANYCNVYAKIKIKGNR